MLRRILCAGLAALGCTVATTAAPPAFGATVKGAAFGIKSAGVECVMSLRSVACQTRGGHAQLAAGGAVTTCAKAGSACVLWSGANYPLEAIQTGQVSVGPFSCVQTLDKRAAASGAVCTVTGSGKGFRVSAAGVAKVALIAPGPYPSCTRAALQAALGKSEKIVAAGGWHCAGNWASGEATVGRGQDEDDVVFLVKASGKAWRSISRSPACFDGVVPAKVSGVCWVD